LAHAIADAVTGVSNVDCVICPPFVALSAVGVALQGTTVALGAQNMHWADSGAYTGEVSAPMLKGLATYVIIGHSERRQYFAETDESVNKKLHAAMNHGLTPILCVGETLAQNQAGETQAIVSMQVEAALQGLSAEQVQTLVIAYEPIWAIGTGLAATAEQAGTICGIVRQVVAAHSLRRQHQREEHRRDHATS
jgi:triosephosphate isomerase